MRIIEKRITTIILLGINVMLSLMIYLVADRTLQDVGGGAEASVPAALYEMPTLAQNVKAYEDYSIISERPLFWSGRQNYTDDAHQMQAAQLAAPPLVLLGVVTGVASKAILTKTDGTEIKTASKGDVVDGWRVEQVEKDFVVITTGGQRRELRVGVRAEKSKQ